MRGERERGRIKVGGARPSHFLRLKITTILLLLYRSPQGTRPLLYSLSRYKSESHALGLSTMVAPLPSLQWLSLAFGILGHTHETGVGFFKRLYIGKYYNIIKYISCRINPKCVAIDKKTKQIISMHSSLL